MGSGREATLARITKIGRLAAPAVLGAASSNVMALVDTAFASRLGAASLAGIGFGVVVHWLSAAWFVGVSYGVQAVSSRRLGAGDQRATADAIVSGLVVVALTAIPMALLVRAFAPSLMHALSNDAAVTAAGVEYLDVRMLGLPFFAANLAFRGLWSGVGRTSVYLCTNVVINALHIALDWLLIFGSLGAPRLGVRGAGLAGALSVFVGALLYLALTSSRLRMARVEGVRRELSTLVRLSVPTGLESVLLFAGFATFYAIAQRVGTVELAITHALSHVTLTAVQFAEGFAIAGATLVGQSLGQRRPAEAARLATLTAGIAAMACALGSATLAIAPGHWLRLLIHDPGAAAMATPPLLLIAAVLPFDAMGIVLARALVGAGATRVVVVTSVGLQWLVLLPALWLGVRAGGGLNFLWVGMMLWRLAFFACMAAAFRFSPWASVKV